MKYIITLILGISILTSLTLLSDSPYVDKAEQIKLYGNPVSPFVRKVMTVLEQKQLAYELDPTLPGTFLHSIGQEVPTELQKASPLGKIPAIRVEEGTLADSAVIVAYLEKKWPRNSLYPSEPYSMAKALWFEQYAGSEMGHVFHGLFEQKVINPKILGKACDEAIVQALLLKAPIILQYLEDSLAESTGRYLVSDELTIGDVAVLHIFVTLQLTDIKLDMSAYPLLEQYLHDGKAHPSIKAVLEKM